jgi:gamma-glutamylaminecyclotransferase
MMLNEPGCGRRVCGELYHVEDWRLRLIDTLESIGQPQHFRYSIEVEPLAGGLATSAFAYMKAHDLATPAHTGYLENYQDRRFIPPEDREP